MRLSHSSPLLNKSKLTKRKLAPTDTSLADVTSDTPLNISSLTRKLIELEKLSEIDIVTMALRAVEKKRAKLVT